MEEVDGWVVYSSRAPADALHLIRCNAHRQYATGLGAKAERTLYFSLRGVPGKGGWQEENT